VDIRIELPEFVLSLNRNFENEFSRIPTNKDVRRSGLAARVSLRVLFLRQNVRHVHASEETSGRVRVRERRHAVRVLPRFPNLAMLLLDRGQLLATGLLRRGRDPQTTSMCRVPGGGSSRWLLRTKPGFLKPPLGCHGAVFWVPRAEAFTR